VDAVHEIGGKIYAQVSRNFIFSVGRSNRTDTPIFFLNSFGMVSHPRNVLPIIVDPDLIWVIVGRVAHPDAPEQKLAGVVGIF
jgi:hypothetical protein